MKQYKYEVRTSVYVESDEVMTPEEVLQVAQFSHPPRAQILPGNDSTFVCKVCGNTKARNGTDNLKCSGCGDPVGDVFDNKPCICPGPLECTEYPECNPCTGSGKEV